MKNMALRWLIFTEGVVKEQGISKRVCSCSWLEWSEPQYELCGVAQGLCALTVCVYDYSLSYHTSLLYWKYLTQ